MTAPGRVERVRARLAARAEALLISDLTNIRWLTGFTGSNGWVVLGQEHLVLVTDGRYGQQAQRQLASAGVEADVLVSGTPNHLLRTVSRASSKACVAVFER